MSSVWRKTLVYLGLVEETEDELPERFGQPRNERAAADRDGAAAPARGESTNVRSLRMPDPGSAHVRSVRGAESDRVGVVAVATFDDAEQIGARYRGGQPVLFDLADLDDTDARRILDFVSGVTYALRGRLVRAGRRAFVLVPDGQEVGVEERRRLASLGYELQD